MVRALVTDLMCGKEAHIKNGEISFVLTFERECDIDRKKSEN